MKSGIYRILNTITGKSYVGSAADVVNRWSQHKANLKKGIHHSKYLQNSYNKHGKSAFLYLLLESCPVDLLETREQFWMRSFNALSPGGYNVHPNARTARGHRYSPQTVAKMRKSALRVANSPGESRRRSLRAKRQHKAGKFGFKTIKISKKEFSRRISQSQLKRDKSTFARGFKWSRKSRLAFSRKVRAGIKAGTWHFGNRKTK